VAVTPSRHRFGPPRQFHIISRSSRRLIFSQNPQG